MATPAPDDRLLRAEELGELLGMSERNVWRLDLSGKLPAPVRIGRAVRWRHNEVQAWLAAGCPPRDEWAVRWEAWCEAQANGRLLSSRPLAS
jgi:predicted DNA-binding transcriptional regulator AlpA